MNTYNPISYVYADKIRYKKINFETGLPWTLEDVPTKYREEVAQILNENF